MATKEAVFSLKVDTGSSVNDIKSFDQAVNSLNKDVNNLQSTVQEGAGTDVFAQKLTELNAKVEAGGLTMRQMTQTMKEYQNIAAAAGMDSPIGQQAIAAAGELKDAIGDIKSQVNALSSDTVKLDTAMGALSGGAAVFQGIESAVALTGVENEQLMQTMVKLQAVQGLVNATNEVAVLLNKEHVVGMQLRAAWEKAYAVAVGQSSGAMKIFRLALISTGIGALIVALGMIIANWDAVTNAVRKAINWFNGLGPVMKLVVGFFMPAIWAVQLLIKGLQMLGIIEDDEDKKKAAVHKRRMQRIDAQIEKERQLREQQKQAFEDGQKQYDREIALASAMGKSTIDLKKQKIQASIDYQEQQIKEIENGIKQFEQIQKMMPVMKNMGTKEKEDAKKKLHDMKEDIKDQKNDIKVINAEAAKDATDKAKEAADAEKAIREDLRKSIIEEQNKMMVSIAALEDSYFNSLLTEQQRQTNAVREKYYTQIKYAEAHKMSTVTLEKAMAAEIALIDLKAAEDKLKKQEELDNKRATLLRAYQGIVMDQYQLELLDFEKAQEDKAKQLNKAHQEGIITDSEYFAAQLALEAEYEKKSKDIADKAAQAEKDANKKKLDEKLAHYQKFVDQAQQIFDFVNSLNDAINQIEEARMKKLADETNAQISELEKRRNAELANANLTGAQKDAINKKFAQQEYQLKLKQYQQEEVIKKRQFEKDKALKIAQIAINTASAIIKGIAEFGPPPSPLGIAAIASAGVLGITQAAAVASQKYEGGQAPTMPDFSSAGGSTGASASSFAPNTNAQQTSLADYLPGGANGPAVSQVVVLESDITGTQQKVSAQQSLSTY
jgi:hypothetical protein